MNLPLRLLAVLLAARTRARLGPLDVSRIELRCWPDDLDLNGHMNNGRYLSLMDLGRWDLVIRLGLAKLAVKHRWRPIVGTAAIRFRRELRLLQRFTLETRFSAWDEKWVYIEQRFLVGSRVHAEAQLRGLFRGPKGNVRPAELLAALGEPTLASPPVPAGFGNA
jgi:acyl-CoA thioesterase FadM